MASDFLAPLLRKRAYSSNGQPFVAAGKITLQVYAPYGVLSLFGRLDSLHDKLSLFQLHCERPSRSLTAFFDGMKAEMSHEKDATSHITFSYYNFQLVSMNGNISMSVLAEQAHAQVKAWQPAPQFEQKTLQNNCWKTLQNMPKQFVMGTALLQTHEPATAPFCHCTR